MSQTPKKSKKLRAVLALVLIAGLITGWFFFTRSSDNKNVIAVSGRIESDDSAVAAKTSGRIREITAREGDTVKAGQVIATLDDEQLNARVAQAQSTVAQADARLQHSRQQVAVLQTQLEQSRISISQARLDAEGRVSQAQAQVAAAEATLAQAESEFKQALYDKEKFTSLAAQGDVSEREGKQYTTTADAQEAVVRAAKRQVEAAHGALVAAKANLDNPAIRASQASGVEAQIKQAEADILSAQADADRARAQLQEAEADRSDLKVVAPFDGTIATRYAEPGEVVAAGAPILTIVNLDKVYLRGFIPEGEIGRVRVGQPARVYLDSNPNHPIEATVSRIDPEASFTPENTYFRNDRVKQVVGVKLQIVNPEGFAKPGMPADGQVLIEGSQWIAETRR